MSLFPYQKKVKGNEIKNQLLMLVDRRKYSQSINQAIGDIG